MADRESGIYFEILHMEDRAGTHEFGKKTGGRDKKRRLNTQDNVWPVRDDFPEGHRRGCQGKAERRKEAPNPAHVSAQQQRTAQNFDARAGFARIAQRRIGRRGAPTRIMRRRRHHANIEAVRGGQMGADLAGEPANANHLRRIINSVNQNFA